MKQPEQHKKQRRNCHSASPTVANIIAQSIQSSIRIITTTTTSSSSNENNNNDIDIMVKRKNDEIDDELESEINHHQTSHDHEQRQQFRTHIRSRNTPEQSPSRSRIGILSGTTSPGGGSSIGTGSLASGGGPSGFNRKAKRLRLYYDGMSQLNKKFANFCKGEELKVVDLCESSSSSELSKAKHFASLPRNYIPDAMFYIQIAQEIKRRYMPATGDVLTFGSGDFGQLGHGYREDGNNDKSTPTCMKSVRNIGITDVSCGGMHNLCLRDNGTVLAWGTNDSGCVGKVGENTETVYTPMNISGFVPSQYEVAKGLEKVPTWKDVIGEDVTNPQIPLDPKYEEKIVSVATGDVHSLCLSSTGRVYFFGAYRDTDGKPWRDMPPKDDVRKYVPPPPTPAEKNNEIKEEPQAKKEGDEVECPVVVEPPKPPPIPPKGTQNWPMHVWQIDGEVLEIACGFSFNAAIVEKKTDDDHSNNSDNNDGFTKQCVTWGVGEKGELARPLSSAVKTSIKKTIINDDGKSREEVIETVHTDVVRDEYLVPKPVTWANPVEKRSVEKIACGGYHLLVISRNLANNMYSVHGSGLNNYGQLGLGKEYLGKDQDKLTEITAFRGKNIVQIAGGNQHSLALESNGNLYAFGRGDYGQMGSTDKQPKVGYSECSPIPVHLIEGSPNPQISEISCGNHQNFVLTTDGDVYSWGYGDTGCLGHGITEDEFGQIPTSDEFRPRKLDVVKRINEVRRKKGENEVTAIVHSVSSGGQHSALVCSLLE